jgi:hypothetical protein
MRSNQEGRARFRFNWIGMRSRMPVMRLAAGGRHLITIQHGSHAAPAVAGLESRSHNSKLLLHRMYSLPESPGRSMFPSGSYCRPPRRQTEAGPLTGPGFLLRVENRHARSDFFLERVNKPDRESAPGASGCRSFRMNLENMRGSSSMQTMAMGRMIASTPRSSPPDEAGGRSRHCRLGTGGHAPRKCLGQGRRAGSECERRRHKAGA